MKTIFVQGDRAATGLGEVIKKMAVIFNEKQALLMLGAYGDVVRLFTEAGCAIHYHGYRQDDRGYCTGDHTYFDCWRIAKDTGVFVSPQQLIAVAWGLRLGMMLTADAYCFFPGQEGTLAHLFPAIAFAVKKKKPLALVGWDHNSVQCLAEMSCQRLFVDPPEGTMWFVRERAEDAAHFLIGE